MIQQSQPLVQAEIHGLIDSAAPYNNESHKNTDWATPEKIEYKLLPVTPLPESIIPEPLRAWIMDICDRMQVPPDFATANAIVMTGAIIGTGCGIKPKRCDNWLIVPNLYGGIVGRPSVMMKSPTQADVLKPLTTLEKEAQQIFDTAIKYHEADCVVVSAKKDKIKTSMKCKNSDVETLKQQYVGLEEPPEPTLRRYRTNDATTEKLSELLNENPRGLLVTKDELTGLFISFEKEGRECDRTFYLEAWNGYGDLYTDRIGRGTIYTQNLCLSVFGGIQPEKLQQYLFANRLTNDGMFQRFQLVVYPDEPKNWQLIDKYPDSEAKNRAYEIIKKLAEIKDFTEYGASQEEGDKIPYLRFTDDAQELFNEWLTHLEIEKIRGDGDSVIIEHLAKYKKLMPALALIFHLIDIADGAPIGAVTLQAAEKAAAWCDYLEQHAKRIYGMAGNVTIQAASNLSRHIAKGEVEAPFTARDIYRHQWRMLTDKDIVQAACDILVSKGWLIEASTPAAFQQKAKTEYNINPKTLGFYG